MKTIAKPIEVVAYTNEKGVIRPYRFRVQLDEEPGKTAYDVNQTLADIQLQYGVMFPKVFKTITSNNGSEFSMLNEQLVA